MIYIAQYHAYMKAKYSETAAVNFRGTPQIGLPYNSFKHIPFCFLLFSIIYTHNYNIIFSDISKILKY